jgi:uncharacterized protein YxjI
MYIPNNICVDEKINFFKVNNTYSVYDEETGEVIFKCKERGNIISQLFKVFGLRNFIPMHVTVSSEEGILFELKRSIWASFRMFYRIKVYSGNGDFLGLIDEYDKINPLIKYYDHRDKLIMKANCREFAHYTYTFTRMGKPIARMDKQWKGRILKELFTTADKYRIEFHPRIDDNQEYKKFVLATCLTIDLLIKERNNGFNLLDAIS